MLTYYAQNVLQSIALGYDALRNINKQQSIKVGMMQVSLLCNKIHRIGKGYRVRVGGESTGSFN